MKYRAEIDGLRALAVLPVILFHAGFEWFSGGFVGVDVFFVISGYLITTIIISEMAEGKFSIVNFYERRARRILPALFFVMAACLPFAWLWLTPSDLKDFGQSLVAVSTFSSNILFWLKSGYFDTAAELKPLLHTWSLAVEEQYYILFPIFLMLTWRLGIKWVVILLSIVFLVSLGVAVWATQYATHPKIISGAFFLLPTRGWELLVGVFAAFYLKYNTHLKSHSLNQALSLLGFCLIVYSIIAFDKTTPFPSLYALVPTIGTGLLILCAVPKTFIHKLLSLKFIVGIGLISYSAYLWHQPLLAFARHKVVGDVAELHLIILCITSLLMAWFSWRFVEAPFRSKGIFSRTFIFTSALTFMFIFCLIGFFTHQTNGFQKDLNIEHSNYQIDGNIMLLGDSHAGNLIMSLQASMKKVKDHSSAGCIPLLNVDRFDSRFAKGDCAKKMTESLNEFVSNDLFELLILNHMGPVYFDQTAFRGKDIARVTGAGVVDVDDPLNTNRWEIFEKKLIDTLEYLTSNSNKRVVYVIDWPELGIDAERCVHKIEREFNGVLFRLFDDQSVVEQCRIPRKEYEERSKKYTEIVIRVSEMFDSVIFVDPTPIFCEEFFCLGIKNDKALYGDVDHLSAYGAYLVSELIVKELGKIEEFDMKRIK